MSSASAGSRGGVGDARNAIRSPRAAAVAGLLFAVIMTTAFVLIRLATGTGHADSSWVEDDAKRGMVSLAINLLPFSGIAFLWFIGVVRDRIGAGEDRLFATVFLGSGLLFIAMLFATGAVAGGLLLGDSDPDVWSFGREITMNLLLVYAMRMAAVFAISTTTLMMRLGIVPRWLSIWGYATAAILLVGSGTLAWLEIVFPLWVLVVSARLLYVTYARPGLRIDARTA